MSEISELKNMLSAHMKKSDENNLKLREDIAIIKTHGEYTKKTLETHGNSIEKLTTSSNRQKGATWVFGFIGIAAIEEFIRNAIK